jgi:putative thiamine transport system permease protein
MATTLQPLTPPSARADHQAAGAGRHFSWLALATPVTLGLLAVPVVAGLAGTLLPAFGWLPALGGHTFGLQAWRELWSAPGFAASVALTLGTGVIATGLSLLLAVAVVIALHGRSAARRLGAVIAPWLAVPHSAVAIGLAFMLLPSGWLVRWVSPGLTGWTIPPDVLTIGHPSGWPIVLGLMVKEVPYLLLMALAALNQVDARRQVAAARVLGYDTAAAWVKVVLPQVYSQMRLPVIAVLAFSLTVVDVALVLGPSHPPTLAVLAVRWLTDPDVSRLFPGAAAASLLLALCAAVVAAGWTLEQGLRWTGRRWLERGGRSPWIGPAARSGTWLAAALLALAGLAGLALLMWSFATVWRYPDAWPAGWTLAHWVRQSGALAVPLAHTVTVAVLSTAISLSLTLAMLEHRARRGPSLAPSRRGESILFLPLVVPQIAFLFGAQVLLVRSGLDGTLLAVVWAHGLFTLPYLYLSLAEPWRALDPRFARTAASLGASPARVFWRVKLPILLRPVLVASAVAFAVSVGLYLPTLFAGAGRVATLTTEAVTLAGGADRRVIGVWAVLQAALPLLAFALAVLLPRWLQPHRREPA